MDNKADNERMRYLSKIKLSFSLDVLLVVVFAITPMIPSLNNLFHGAITTLPLFIIWFFFVLYKNRGLNEFYKVLADRKTDFVLLFSFWVVVCMNYALVSNSERAFQYVVVFLQFILVTVMDSYYAVRPPRYKFSILFLIVVALGIQAAVSLPYLLSSGTFITRLLASGQLTEVQQLEAIRHGVGKNDLYTGGAAIAFLGLALFNKYRGLGRLIALGATVFLILSIFISTFLASVLMLVVGGVILMIRYSSRVFNGKVLLYTGLLSAVIYFFYTTYVADTRLLMPVTAKLERFQQTPGDVTGRSALAEASWETFQDHPFFGIGVPELGSYHLIGEHFPWLDYFANFGVVGFSPLIFYLFLSFYRNRRYYFSRMGTGFYSTACFIGFTIFILSNFISPLVSSPIMYIMFILFYSSYSNYGKYSISRI